MNKNYNLACAVHLHSQLTPQAVAVVCQGRSLSYGELAGRAASLAACLINGSGWHREDGGVPRVGILASRGVDACVAMLGACWAGATYIPIGLNWPPERILLLMSQCGLSALVADERGTRLLTERLLAACPPMVVHMGNMPAIAPNSAVECIDLAGLPSAALQEPAPMAASDTAYTIFTSGTTGIPKGVMIGAGATRHYAAMIAEHLGLQSSDRALETCELSFDFSVHNMFSTWEAGAALHILPATTVMNAVKFARNSGVTVWNSVPSLAGMLRQIKALAPGSLGNLRVTVFGGEQLPASTVHAWQIAAPHSTIVNLYGPTEATVFCMGQTITPLLPLTPGRDVVAIGLPLPGSEAMVIDAQGRALADGVTGELAIAGVQLAEGYWGAQALSAQRFPTIGARRWYRTGDLAMRDASGRFHCLGRIDNQVKVMGYRIELEEIDAHLRVVSGADIVGSVAWPLADGAARGIVGFVGAATVDHERILGELKTRIPSYMVPTRIVALEKMPLSASGKVDRAALRQILESESL